MPRAPDSPKHAQMNRLELDEDWLRTTQRGHRRPDLAASGVTCLLHTPTAVYALDDEGGCLSVARRDGTIPAGESRCVGAQYVACFVPASPEGLFGEPRPGAQALFVGRGSTGRAALLRTGVITAVEYRDEQGLEVPPPRERWESNDVDLAWDVVDPRATMLCGVPAVRLPS